MKPLKINKIFFLALIFPTLWSCSSDKLTREKAEKIIKTSIKFPYAESIQIPNSYTVGPNGETPEGYGDDSETKEMHDFFLNNKLMTIARTWVQENNFWSNVVTGFTEEGKKYTIRIEDKQWSSSHKIKLYEIIFNEITGIQINEQTNNATVEFSLKRSNWSPFGEYYKGKEPDKYSQIVTGKKAILQKYDDGWRFVKEVEQ